MEAPISVIIPAHNEERYLGETLEHIGRARAYLQSRRAQPVEVTVVDNASTDDTPNVARSHGANVLHETVRNIGRVRNAGATASTGDVLVFVDADTLIPETLLWRIAQAMDAPECVGGAVAIAHSARRTLVRAYLRAWKILGDLLGMAQGATQFCRRDAFMELKGYDETLYMGEDVDFYWRLRKHAERQGRVLCFIDDVQVTPSPRRFDQWPLWRILVWTNPLYALLFRRKIKAWAGWYQTGPR